MRILAMGPLWRGSNAGGLFRALSREGCMIEIVDEFYFISLQTTKKPVKIIDRIIRPLQVREYNDAIIKKISAFQPQVVFVYKGMFVLPDTLHFAKKNNCHLVLFYPDVSLTAHGANIPNCLPLYDEIFTTKTFGIKDMSSKYGINNTFFIPHGFDPEIHRPLKISNEDFSIFGCDVSFIGTWSAKKEKFLSFLKEHVPEINLKIWGGQWDRATAQILKKSIEGKPVIGDLYAMAIQCSKINLGILSEKVSGSSSGDLITSRTFHIPGASGFMLHERNEESTLYYNENEEAGFFDGPEELVAKVKYYLSNDAKREEIRLGGYKRAVAGHSLDARARVILNELKRIK